MSFSEKLLNSFFARVVKVDQLTIIFASGKRYVYGDGQGQMVSVRFASKNTEYGILLNPALKLGEAYMDGEFIVDEGNIYDFLSLMARNGAKRLTPWPVKLLAATFYISDRLRNLWRKQVEKRDVAHHYDLDDRLFELFLDDDWQYTCAYFENDEQTLEQAQLAKKRHVTAKLQSKAGLNVLEMGCGWGGLALYIAEMTGAHVTGVTLSENQVAVAKQRAKNRKLDDLTEFRLQNYRDVEGVFDRIISIGMLEHVGRQNYDVMFKKSFELLKKEGVMVVHAIGRPKSALTQDRFNDKYIFPGAYVPSVGQVVPAIEQAGFLIKDIEILPIHYAKTCRMWRQRFVANWDKAAELYDERFCRMWELYLAASEVAFRHHRFMIFQIILAKHQDVVPFTRGYIEEHEDALRQLEKTRLTVDKVII